MLGIFKVGSQQKYEATIHHIEMVDGTPRSIVRVITFPIEGDMTSTFPIWQIKPDKLAIVHPKIDKQHFVGTMNIWDNTFEPFRFTLKPPEDRIRAVFLKDYIFIR